MRTRQPLNDSSRTEDPTALQSKSGHTEPNRRKNRRTDKHVSLQLAYSQDDLIAAYGLVYERYIRLGYQKPNPSKFRFLIHCCLPTTYTFVAVAKGRVIATLSLIDDQALGLPMEQVYSKEINGLRDQGKRLAEISCLATRRFSDRAVMLRLFRTMYAYARHSLGITDICIAVHPKQCFFYERVFLFDRMGEIRNYSNCHSAPAVALHLDVADLENRFQNAHGLGMIGRFFIGQADYKKMAHQLAPPTKTQLLDRYHLMQDFIEWQALEGITQQQIAEAYNSIIA